MLGKEVSVLASLMLLPLSLVKEGTRLKRLLLRFQEPNHVVPNLLLPTVGCHSMILQKAGARYLEVVIRIRPKIDLSLNPCPESTRGRCPARIWYRTQMGTVLLLCRSNAQGLVCWTQEIRPSLSTLHLHHKCGSLLCQLILENLR